MGRGLSELQETILIMARENRAAYGLGPIAIRVFFYHPGLELTAPAGFDGISTSDEFKRWVESRADPEYLARLRRNSAAMAGLAEGLIPEPSGRYVIPRDEELRVINLVESIDDLGVWPEEFRYLTSLGGDRYASRVYRDQAEADGIAGRLEARGFKARSRTMAVDHADLYSWEVMGKVYGFEQHRKTMLGGYRCRTHHPDEAASVADIEKYGRDHYLNRNIGHRCQGGKFYDVEAIGRGRYNAAKVATSKAFRRIRERGLGLVYRWRETAGIKLTTEGVEVADRLMANRENNVRTVSQYREGPAP